MIDYTVMVNIFRKELKELLTQEQQFQEEADDIQEEAYKAMKGWNNEP